MFTPVKEPRNEAGRENGSISRTESEFDPNSRSLRRGGTLVKCKNVGSIENDGTMGQEFLVEKVSRLENELFEYQYNMGLLLIEKKEWNVKYEESKRASAEVADTLKREQAAHSIAISEAEKREENLKTALGVERQCVNDLERALREMRSGHAEIKFNTNSKLAEANALVASVEEKSLEVEAKVHEADAKLAEVSRKNAEVVRKLHELEAQENTLRRERFFFTSERETYETTLSRQREDLRKWEQKLKDGEDRLIDVRRLLNQREERANENDKILKKKQSDLEELHKKIEMENSTMKSKEDDISSRIASLAIKEKEVDAVGNRLELKEKTLIEWEVKLNTREELEIQKQLDEHKTILEEKLKEFELEMDQRRKVHDEQLKSRGAEMEKKESEINHMEEKLKKRDQAVEKKLEKLREKEVDFDSKSKALKEREKSLKVEEKILEQDRKQIHSEKEELLNVKAELENLSADIEKQRLALNEKNELLKVTEDEKLNHDRLQSELKQEMNKWRLQNEQLLKEANEMKVEKERFEREWEYLDDQRAEIEKELEDLLKQKNDFDKVKHSEDERLNEEKLETKLYLQRELESLKLDKDSFDAHMEHEKSVLSEKYESEKNQLLHDFEIQRRELETKMQKTQDEMDHHLRNREKSFEEEREAKLNNITYLREVAKREMEEMKLERNGMEKEKMEILHNKKHVETQHYEMKNDITELIGLSQKLKDQREQFANERKRFIAFVEKQKNCTLCGEIISEYILSDLHPLSELEDLEPPPLPKVAENYMKKAVEETPVRSNSEVPSVLLNSASPAGGTMSWFRKCTSKVFKFSPGKKLEIASALVSIEADSHGRQGGMELQNTLTGGGTNEQEIIRQVADDSFDFEKVPSGSGIREVDATQNLSSNQNLLDNPANSRNSDVKSCSREPYKDARPRVIRTRSVKAVIAGAEAILGKCSQENETHCHNGSAENSTYLNGESKEKSDLVRTSKNRRKRNNMLVSQETVSGDSYSEGHSNRRKKPQRAPAAEQGLVEKRYNLRRPKVLAATMANGSSRESRRHRKTTGSENGKEDRLPGLIYESGGASREEIHEPGALSGGFHGRGGDEPARSTEAASEFSADSPARFKIAEDSRERHIEILDTFMDDTNMVEGINGTAESESRGRDDDDDDEGNDDDQVHPGEVSVGKKLWNFLTT